MTWFSTLLAVASDWSAWAIPAAALIISIFTYVFLARDIRQRAKMEYVTELEHRITTCEKDRADLHKENQQLRQKNQELEEKVMGLMWRVWELEGRPGP